MREKLGHISTLPLVTEDDLDRLGVCVDFSPKPELSASKKLIVHPAKLNGEHNFSHVFLDEDVDLAVRGSTTFTDNLFARKFGTLIRAIC